MSSGGKLRKMVSRYKDAQKVEEEIREELDKLAKEKKDSEEYIDTLVHGYFIYECRDCGAVYKMWLEKGLEDPVQDKDYPEKHKPVPFGIRCECGSFNCTHVLWGIGSKESYELLRKGESYFKNDPTEDCGVPVLDRSYHDRHAFVFSECAGR